MNSLFFLLLFLPYSSLSATIDSAATEDYDGYAMQSLHLPYHREANRYRDDVQAPSQAQLATSRNEMQLREIAREAGRLLNAHLPRIRYSGVRNTNPSDEGLAQLLKEYEQLRDEVSRLERTLSPADKRRRLILDSSSPTTPFPPPPPTLPPSTPSPLPALLQPIPPAKQIKRRKLRKHRRLNELPLLSDPSLIEALQKGQVFILKENKLQAIDATQSAALSEELRKSSVPVSLPLSRSEPVISLPLIPLPSPTTTTPEPTTTTPPPPPPTTTTPLPTTLPPLNDQEELFLSQLKALFPGDPSLDAKFNEYRQRMGTTSPPSHPSSPAPSPPPSSPPPPSPPPPSPPPPTTLPPTLTPPPSPPPSLPIRSFVFVPGTSLRSNTSPPISPVLSFLPTSEALPLRELSTEIHPLNRPHASSQPIAVPESFGRRSGALFVNGKGEIVDGKGNRLDFPLYSKATPDTVSTVPIQAPILSPPIPSPQTTSVPLSPTVPTVQTNEGTLEQLQRLQKLYEQYVHQINSAVSLPTVSQPAPTVPPSVPPPQVTSSPVVQSLPHLQYPSTVPRSLTELSSAQSLQQPTVVQPQPLVNQYFVATSPQPTVPSIPTTVPPTASPVPTASQVDLSQFTSKTFPIPSTTLLPSTTVSPSTSSATVPSSKVSPTTIPSTPSPVQHQYPSYPSYPSPYNPFYPHPSQSKVEAPVFERYSTWEVPAGAGDILKSNSTSNSSLPQTLLLVDPTKKANDPPTVIQLPPNYPSYPSSPQQSPRGYYPPYPQYPYPPYGSPYGGGYPSYGGSPYGGWPAYPTPSPSTPHPLSKLFSQAEPTTPPLEGPSPASSQPTPQVISPQEAAAILAQFYSQSPKKH